jgi:glucosamine-6-phosphate deaminase
VEKPVRSNQHSTREHAYSRWVGIRHSGELRGIRADNHRRWRNRPASTWHWTNGHIGFNEPTSSLASRTRLKTLSKKTIQDNAFFFGGNEAEVPHHCITMGIGTIMEAREIVLLAFGEAKASAVAAMVEGPVTAMVPASILQHHQDAKLYIDEAASSALKLSEYYRWIQTAKPEWPCDV